MIFGQPMDTWCRHMPIGMCLKSEGFASNLSDPRGELTLAHFCAEEGLEYGDVGVPVRLNTFERYGRAFQLRFVAGLRRQKIEVVRPVAGSFELTTETGETLHARCVIVANGVQGYAHVGSPLKGLPSPTVIHSYDQRDPALWLGRRVAVVGAGQSALDAAVLLHEAGAEVVVVARTPQLVWNPDPVLGSRSLWRRIRHPSSGLGDGPRMRLYANHPLLMHAAPARQRLQVAYTALGPAGAWWLRPRFEGRVQALLGRSVSGAEIDDGEVRCSCEGLREKRRRSWRSRTCLPAPATAWTSANSRSSTPPCASGSPRRAAPPCSTAHFKPACPICTSSATRPLAASAR